MRIKWSKNTKNTFFEKMSKIGFGHMVPGMSITDTKHYFCPKGSPNSLWNNFESISDPNLEYTTKNLKFPRVKIGIHEIALYYGDFDQKWKPEKWWKKLVCNKWCKLCIYPTCNTFFVQRGPQPLSEKNLSRFKGHFCLLLILLLLLLILIDCSI